ncbi:MAG: glycosyltransferase family 4 protein [Flavobacterium sp.]
MKILYVVPSINNDGGVARVLALKANYLIRNWQYDVHIVTQNQGHTPLFYEFDVAIAMHDIALKKNAVGFVFDYITKLKKIITTVQPDVVLVCDNGLKAFLLPFFLGVKMPLILEIHSSKFIEERPARHFLDQGFRWLKYRYKNFCANHFSQIVYLSENSKKEWNNAKGVILHNPVWIENVKVVNEKQKIVLAIARNCYEKGLDRLLPIWSSVTQEHPDWKLHIIGDQVPQLQAQVNLLDISDSVCLQQSVTAIDVVYATAAVFVLSSRFDCYPMVLIEAMASGLPCVAYDCPCGPAAIIEPGVTGFLIPNGNQELFVSHLKQLLADENLRIDMGKKGKEKVADQSIEVIMEQWHAFLRAI